MKPRNFPGRRLRRVATAKWNQGIPLTADERLAMQMPKDIKQRIGKKRRCRDD